MRYIRTLTNIGRDDSEDVGFRASDLGLLREKGFNVPLSFVITSDAFDDFLSESGLRAKVDKIYKENSNPSKAFEEVMSAFIKAAYPQDMRNEFCEAYDSLGIEPGSSAHSLISAFGSPFITLMRSPSYLLPTEDEEGILQNVKGSEQLLAAVKLIWASAFSPASIHYRIRSGLSHDFSMGIIVQKMKKTHKSAIAYSRTEFNEYMLRVKSFKGLLDYGECIMGKDEHDIDVNSLLIRNSKINVQEYAIIRDSASDELVKKHLMKEGEGQKLNDKLIAECARVAKRAKSFIGKDVKLYLSIHDEIVNVIQANRLVYEKKKEVVAKEEVKMREYSDGHTSMEHEHDESVRETEEKDMNLTMPEILSSEEARERVVRELGHKVFSLNGFETKDDAEEEPCEEREHDDIEMTDMTRTDAHTEVVPEEGSPEAIEEEVEKEESLLEQVMEIKALAEKMESHALNDHKEGYEQEARRLKKLLSRIRDS
ncbi:hypothetical protein JW711_01980 [Candidatus Woesearchaeota archaeon]|nr:hypothetical protein [Candidatus Woesearchaeota archaeon]